MLSSRRIPAICWIFGWIAFFTGAMTLIKFLSPEIGSWTIVFMRSIFGLFYLTPFLLQGGLDALKTQFPGRQLIRVVLGSCAMACTYYAYQHLPLSTATSIGLSSPLIVPVFSMLMIREKIPSLRWLAIAAGYAGVLCVVRPTFEGGLQWAMGVALLGNMLAASAMMITKQLSKTESTEGFLLYSGLAIFVLSACVNVFCWQSFGWRDGMLLALIGGAGLLSQYCSLSALRSASPSFIAPFEYSRLLFALAVDVFLFGESLTLLTVLGSLTIIASSYTVVQSEKAQKEKAQKGKALMLQEVS